MKIKTILIALLCMMMIPAYGVREARSDSAGNQSEEVQQPLSLQSSDPLQDIRTRAMRIGVGLGVGAYTVILLAGSGVVAPLVCLGVTIGGGALVVEKIAGNTRDA